MPTYGMLIQHLVRPSGKKSQMCAQTQFFFFGDVLEYLDNRAFFISMAANGQKWLMNESAVPDDF